MSGLVLTVEIVAGTAERDAAASLAALAEKLGVIIEANHNGTRMWALPGDDVDAIMQEFVRERGLANYPDDF